MKPLAGFTTPMLSLILAILHPPDAAGNVDALVFCIVIEHDSAAAQHHAVQPTDLRTWHPTPAGFLSTRLSPFAKLAKLATHSFDSEDEGHTQQAWKSIERLREIRTILG